MDSSARLAENLSRLRKQKGLSRAALADKVGIDMQTIYQYEKGARWPKGENLDALATALAVQPWQLLAAESEVSALPTAVVDLASQLARACGLKVSAGKNS